MVRIAKALICSGGMVMTLSYPEAGSTCPFSGAALRQKRNLARCREGNLRPPYRMRAAHDLTLTFGRLVTQPLAWAGVARSERSAEAAR